MAKKEVPQQLSEQDLINQMVLKELNEQKRIKEEREQQVNEIIKSSPIYKYLDDDVTDINFDGRNLRLQYRNGTYTIVNNPPKAHEIMQFVTRIANASESVLNTAYPIMDTEFGFLRVNAQHTAVSPDGVTMSLRISKPKLVVDNIREFTYENSIVLEELFKVFVLAEINLILGGRTGSGKTEFQKLLARYISDSAITFLIEDTRDSHIKALYPDKIIYSSQTLLSKQRKEQITMSDLVKSALRNNPDWTIIAETRGREAADALDSVKTDHSIITSIHIKGAKSAASRMIPMIRQDERYAAMSDMAIGSEIVQFMNISVYLRPIDLEDGTKQRVIKEIFEFTHYTEAGGQGHYLYRITQEYDEETNTYQYKQIFNPLSEATLDVLKDKRLFHEVPKIFRTKGTKVKLGDKWLTEEEIEALERQSEVDLEEVVEEDKKMKEAAQKDMTSSNQPPQPVQEETVVKPVAETNVVVEPPQPQPVPQRQVATQNRVQPQQMQRQTPRPLNGVQRPAQQAVQRPMMRGTQPPQMPRIQPKK